MGLALALGLGLRLGLGSVGLRVGLGSGRAAARSPPDVERLVVEPEEREEGRPPRGAGWAVGVQHELRAHVRRRCLDRQQPHRRPQERRQGGRRRRWFLRTVHGVVILITHFQARGGRHASHTERRDDNCDRALARRPRNAAIATRGVIKQPDPSPVNDHFTSPLYY